MIIYNISASSLLIGAAWGHCSAFPLIHNVLQESLHFSFSSPPSFQTLKSPSPATISPEASPDLSGQAAVRVMDGQNYVRRTFCCSRFIHHQEKTG